MGQRRSFADVRATSSYILRAPQKRTFRTSRAFMSTRLLTLHRRDPAFLNGERELAVFERERFFAE